MKCSELQSELERWQAEFWPDRISPPDSAQPEIAPHEITGTEMGRGDSAALPGTPEIATHLSTCADCRQEWEAVRALADAVSAWREQVPAVDLTSAVLLEYSRELPHVPDVPMPATIALRTNVTASNSGHAPVVGTTTISSPIAGRQMAWSRGALGIVLTGLAALLMLSIAPATHRVSVDRGSAVALSPTPTTGHRPLQGQLQAPAENVQSLVHNAGSAYLALAQQTAGAMRGITTLVVPEQGTAGLTLDNVPALSTGLVNELETDFKPLRDSVGGVFNFLWNTANIPDKTAT